MKWEEVARVSDNPFTGLAQETTEWRYWNSQGCMEYSIATHKVLDWRSEECAPVYDLIFMVSGSWVTNLGKYRTLDDAKKAAGNHKGSLIDQSGFEEYKKLTDERSLKSKQQ